jgi:antitoxin component of MazEF toxin-antitoxin module
MRIPRPTIEQTGQTNNVELVVEVKELIVQSASSIRKGWLEQFAELAKYNDDMLLDEITPTQWDDEEWTW